MPYATVTPTDEFDVLPQKTTPMKQYSSARTQAHDTRARANFDIYCQINFIIVTNEFDDPNFAGWLKGVKIGTATLGGQLGVINLQFFLHN